MTIASNLSFLENAAGAITTGTINAQYAPITFSINSSEAGRFDLNNYLLLGYTTSQGAYRLQVNGNMLINGTLSVTTASFTNVVGVITTASNIAGGAAGQIVYQSAPGLTAFSSSLTFSAGSGLSVGGNINFTGNLYQNGSLFSGGGGGTASGTGTTTTFVISNITPTNSTITGALQVYGGMGIGGGIYSGGTVTATNLVTAGVGGGISGASYVNSFNMWATGTLTATNLIVGGNAFVNGIALGSSTGTTSTYIIQNTTPSNSTNSGALQVWGGAGIGLGLVVGGVVTATSIATTGLGGGISGASYVNSFNMQATGTITATSIVVTGTATSTSTLTGAVVITGGVGIGGNLYVGGSIFSSGGSVGAGGSAGGTTYTNVIANGFVQSPYPYIAPKGRLNHGPGTVAFINTSTTGSSPWGITTDAFGNFAYVANYTAGTITQYVINTYTGFLTTSTFDIATGTNPYGITSEPTGRFVYAANYGASTVGQFFINTFTGTLTQITTAIASGTNPYGITSEPTGKYVYVANYGAATISQYAINTTTGALISIGTPISAGTNPVYLAADPTGRFLYAANYGSANISQYAISTGTGILISLGTAIAAGTNPFSIGVDPSGRFVYAANYGSANISQYSINQFSGTLTQITTAVSVGANPGSGSLAIDPYGKYVYVGNSTILYQYSINQYNGALTQVASIAAGPGQTGMTIDPTGKYLFSVNNTNATVAQYGLSNFSVGGLVVGSAQASTSTTTGAVIVQGGIGVGGAVWTSALGIFTPPGTANATIGGINNLFMLFGTISGVYQITSGIVSTTNMIVTGYEVASPLYIGVGGTASYSLSTTSTNNVLLVGSTGYTATLLFPTSSLQDGQIVRVAVSGNAVAITVSNVTLLPALSATSIAAGSAFAYSYRLANNTWYRIQFG
jgi:6-phosphogluconolactonase (cycloisomerase 2 family)